MTSERKTVWVYFIVGGNRMIYHPSKLILQVFFQSSLLLGGGVCMCVCVCVCVYIYTLTFEIMYRQPLLNWEK